MPRDVSPLPLGTSPAVALATGTEFSCAQFANGNVKCWGRNVEGQLGTGDFMQVGGAAGLPLAMGASVALGGPADGLRAGANHVCAIVAGAGTGTTANAGRVMGSMPPGTTLLF